jgi:hypothetical protein
MPCCCLRPCSKLAAQASGAPSDVLFVLRDWQVATFLQRSMSLLGVLGRRVIRADWTGKGPDAQCGSNNRSSHAQLQPDGPPAAAPGAPGDALFAPRDWAAAFTSQTGEFEYWVDDVEGAVPEALRGTLFRNGPGNFGAPVRVASLGRQGAPGARRPA